MNLTPTDIIEKLNTNWLKEYPELTKLQFSDWVNWPNRNKILNIDKLGVYIIAKYQESSLPTDVDPLDEAVICIGRTNGRTRSLKIRCDEFDGAVSGKAAHHAEGESYRDKYGDDYDNLYISICPLYWKSKPKKTPLKELDSLDSDAFYFFQHRILAHYITLLEVGLRGVYVLKWGKLPESNKE